MLILAIDTTTRFGSVALVSSGNILAEVNYASPSSHSRQVFRAMDELLGVAGIKVSEIEGLAVAAGPGSFTGIRIGLSLTKALALASEKLVAPVSSLEALARKLIFPGVELISPVIDARKGEIFACTYLVAGLKLKEIIPPAAYNPREYLKLLSDKPQVYFIGTGVDLYRLLIWEILKERARFVERTYFIAAEVGKLGEKLLEKGQGVSPAQLEPIYYRKSQAEEKKAEKTE
ncbi:MAG TPA: tRNA (adenosine(37)-N6)-threonylcarbamoyltransferase complex dimerization subunit type 1 TsaB [Candidatus Aminicenantes bacterium]|nr:MAG: tRNA (adenosine(37)-N6)-threonylcarbamoyltransferase complex dimerization subunit type 1 TsaB [Candidatus Aminicenantes bacterium]HEK84739.1 tRNA (adenosine(37)-N6)-threonylcarbamoyltransferase complex dimerization subunit type 1 TsaB [Candidatus Aminicenantes bacterium]